MTALSRRSLALALTIFTALPLPALAETTTAEPPAEAPADNSVIEMALGNPDAKVTVIEYASFTCPHCAHFHDDQFPKLKADYIDTGKINFIYRDVYFDRVGLWAAMLARCEPDRFFGVSDLIYSRQKEWLNSQDAGELAANLRKLGKVAGLEDDKIDACMADADKAKAQVDWFNANMEVDKIEGTPSLVIDGTVYGNRSYDEIKKIIDEMLAAE